MSCKHQTICTFTITNNGHMTNYFHMCDECKETIELDEYIDIKIQQALAEFKHQLLHEQAEAE